MKILERLVLTLLLVSLVPATVHAWTHDRAGSPIQLNSFNTRAVADGVGGTFVVYTRYTDGTSGYDVLAQHYDADGKALWAAPGKILCNRANGQILEQAVPDGAGGLVAVWSEIPAAGYDEADLWGQRVGADGSMVWTVNGKPFTTASGRQERPRLAVSTSAVWCVWQDNRNQATTGIDVYAQALWVWSGAEAGTAGGFPVCVATGPQYNADIGLDVFGSARIAWDDARALGQIYAQKLQVDGSVSWAVNGIPVCSYPSQQTLPRVRCLGSSQVLLLWSDGRNGSYDVYGQLLDDYSMLPTWDAQGVRLCDASGDQFVGGLALDAAGAYVVLMEDTRAGWNNQNLYVQKIGTSGVPQWALAGVPVRVAGGGATQELIASDGAGGSFVAWVDARTDAGDIYLQRLGADGAPLWPVNGVVVSNVSGSQAAPSLAVTRAGQPVVSFDDFSPVSTSARVQGFDEWGYCGAAPVLASVKDVPNDQGGQVKVSWYGSPLDTDPLYRNITDYLVFRSVPARLAAQLATRTTLGEDGTATARLDGKRYVRVPSAAQDYFWEELAHVTPRHLSQYSYVATTEGDSIAGSNPRTAFMVMALANDGSAWWVTNADSGYSVDNIAPLAPAPLTGQYGAGTTALHWMPNTEADLAGYRIYRGSSASFTPSLANRVAAVADTGYADAAAAPYFYKVTAVDTHGNESPVATLMPSGTLAVGGEARAMFAAPAPNPLRGGAASTLRFALAQGGRTKLALYDAQGRVARVLVDGALEAGEHAVTLKGEGLAPGLYLARLESPGFAATRRVMVVE